MRCEGIFSYREMKMKVLWDRPSRYMGFFFLSSWVSATETMRGDGHGKTFFRSSFALYCWRQTPSSFLGRSCLPPTFFRLHFFSSLHGTLLSRSHFFCKCSFLIPVDGCTYYVRSSEPWYKHTDSTEGLWIQRGKGIRFMEMLKCPQAFCSK